MIKFVDMPSPTFQTRDVDGQNRARGFTLIEMLVSILILVILMAIIFQIIQLTSSAYKQSTQSTGTMQQARVAFERMTRNLSQATLNTYYGYFYATSTSAPTYYLRLSELQFVSGWGPVAGAANSTFVTTAGQNAVQVTHAVFFQAPLGAVSGSDTRTYGNMGNLLNACGYFVTYGPDTSRPNFLNSSGFASAPPSENRFRLMEYLQPSENLNIYTQLPSGVSLAAATSVPPWITNGLPTDLTAASPANVRPLASNIVALIIMPEEVASASGTVTVSSNGEANTIPLNTPAAAANPYYVPPIPANIPSYATSVYNAYGYDSCYKALTPKVITASTSTPVSSSIQFPTGNQLPPLVKVVMVAIDDASGARLAAKYSSATSTSPPDLGNLITSTAALFQKPAQLFTGTTESDLQLFEDILNASPGNKAGNTVKCNYYVFQSDVIIRGAKWTVN